MFQGVSKETSDMKWVKRLRYWGLFKRSIKRRLCEKFPNTEFFLVRIFPQSD